MVATTRVRTVSLAAVALALAVWVTLASLPTAPGDSRNTERLPEGGRSASGAVGVRSEESTGPTSARVAVSTQRGAESGSVTITCLGIDGLPVADVDCCLLKLSEGRRLERMWWRARP